MDQTNLWLLTPDANFGAGGGNRTVPHLPSDHLLPGVRRPSLYAAAQTLCRDMCPVQVVDFGCGNARGLSSLEVGRETRRRAVDSKRVLQVARAAVPTLEWVECDLECEGDLARAQRELTSEGGPQLFVVADVLERLRDPRPFLRMLRTLLFANARSRVLLSIIHRSWRGGASIDPCHVRTWSREEMLRLLAVSGFETLAVEQPGDGAVLLTLSADRVRYDRMLEEWRLPRSELDFLLVSTEHALGRITGGIGTYCAQLQRSLGSERVGFFYATDPSNLSVDRDGLRWFFRDTFLVDSHAASLELPELVEQCVRIILFLYDRVQTIELQDYLGIGALVVQARRAGLLPDGITVQVRCHGSHVYLEQCFSRFSAPESMRHLYAERVALEHADRVSFPTRFLHDLYREQGYRIAEDRIVLAPLPFDFNGARARGSYEAIDTVIFFGKRSKMKGFPVFVEALSALFEAGKGGAIRRVVTIGRLDSSLDRENCMLAAMRDRVELIEFEGPSREAIALIQANAHRAICLLPYQGDNHPVSVLEAISTGCQILAAAAGGIPEMIPEELHSAVLHPPSAEALRDALERVLSQSAEEREVIATLTLERTALRYAPSEVPLLTPALSPPPPRQGSVGVVIPCFNTDLAYVEELIEALNHQRRPPDRVCFVDDGSLPGYDDALRTLARERLLAPFQVIRHPQNRGLAAARNTALCALDTDYVVNIDSDDIPRPELLARYAHCLDDTPEFLAVTCWLESFEDGRDWRDAANCQVIYRPLGDGWVPGQLANCFGHANSAVRRKEVLALGGFDDIDCSMWEDWALFLRIVGSGGRIGVVPRSEILYRVRPGSMARTYGRFSAMNRLARNLPLPRFDALRLQGYLRELDSLRERVSSLQEENARMKSAAGRSQDVASPAKQWASRRVRSVARVLRRVPRALLTW